MAGPVLIELEMPGDLERFTLPDGVKRRLQALLDKQDEGAGLSSQERVEAEGLWILQSSFRCSSCARGGRPIPKPRERKLCPGQATPASF